LLCGNIALLAHLREAQRDAVDVGLEQGRGSITQSGHYHEVLALPDQLLLLLLDDVWLRVRVSCTAMRTEPLKRTTKVNNEFSVRRKLNEACQKNARQINQRIDATLMRLGLSTP